MRRRVLACSPLVRIVPRQGIDSGEERPRTYLSSAIPAKALYQARNAANNAKYPPALIIGVLGAPSVACKYPILRSKNAMSRVKKSKKKATVERSVQISSKNVKMNHPIRKNPKAFAKSFTPAPVAFPVVASTVAYAA